jgi:hypothetical protein
MMMDFSKLGLAAASAALLIVSANADARPARGKVAGPSGSVSGATGENGSTVRGRRTVQNEDGSVTTTSGRAAQTTTGAKGARLSTTTVNPDGSANRQSAAAAEGPSGSAATSSNVTRNADGSYSGGRTSTATNNSTGATYHGSTQIDPATGKPVRVATCTDASGTVIACPR